MAKHYTTAEEVLAAIEERAKDTGFGEDAERLATIAQMAADAVNTLREEKAALLAVVQEAEAVIAEELEPHESAASSPGVDAVRKALSQVRAAIDKAGGEQDDRLRDS